jgi:hypothetical protein
VAERPTLPAIELRLLAARALSPAAAELREILADVVRELVAAPRGRRGSLRRAAA